jgi:putative CocE/NonD family hydrolase
MHQRQHTLRTCSVSFLVHALIVAVAVTGYRPAAAQVAPPVRQIPDVDIAPHYSWHEYQIPMRDGVRLYTSVLSPNDTTRSYPILMERTPYGASPHAGGFTHLPEREFTDSGYIFVYQDVRGRYQSEGFFTQNTPQKDQHRRRTDVDESTDTYDTVDWLIKHVPNNNQRVGLRGISYSGFFAAMGMIDAHPALKAVSPQAAEADWFIGDDVHHHGAMLLDSGLYWMTMCMHNLPGSTVCTRSGMDYGTDDGYEFSLRFEPLSKIDSTILHGTVPAWTELMQHGIYDEYWKSRNELRHIANIRPAILMVSGWYDANDFYGTLHIYQWIAAQSAATSLNIAVGPWYHGQWRADDGSQIDQISFGAPTSIEFLRNIELPFFEHYLKGAKDPALPKAYMFETGANRWRQFDAWPPRIAVAKAIYLRENGRLDFAPTNDRSAELYDEYLSDPKRPVPYTPIMTTDMDPLYMARDQRFVRRRPDVLDYESDVLTEDLTIAGPIVPKLFVSTTGTDADWIVKLIDVNPESPPSYDPSAQAVIFLPKNRSTAGFEQLVRGDVIRAKFRNSLENPQPMTPGEITPVEFTMDDVLHTFKKGHRIKVQIQSTWFPLVDLNPQKFVNIYEATETDFGRAVQKVYRSAANPSQIAVRVLPTAE